MISPGQTTSNASTNGRRKYPECCEDRYIPRACRGGENASSLHQCWRRNSARKTSPLLTLSRTSISRGCPYIKIGWTTFPLLGSCPHSCPPHPVLQYGRPLPRPRS